MSTSKLVVATQAESEEQHKLALDGTIGKAAPPKLNQSSTSADKRETMSLDDTFSFGKYRDKLTLLEAIEKSPSYIQWLMSNNIVYFTDEAYTYIEENS